MNEYINLGEPFNDFVRKNSKLGRFNFKVSSSRKSPKQIGRFLIKHHGKKKSKPKRKRASPKAAPSLKRELSDPEYCMKKVNVGGFDFTIIDEPEKMDEKIKYLTDKIRENLLQTLEINKIALNDSKYVEALLDEKNKIKSKINNYNNQLNEIMDNIF
jgi:hypothetical protein